MQRIITPERGLILPRGFRREDYERHRIERAPFSFPPSKRIITPIQAAISQRQVYVTNVDFGGGGTTLTAVYGSVPTAGDLGFAYGACSNTTTGSFSDNTGDGVAWNSVSLNPIANSNDACRLYIGWKQFGTMGSNKTVTFTSSANSVLEMAIGDYNPGAGGLTWSVDGTPVKVENTTSTNPNPGAITVSAGGLIIGGTMHDTATITAVAGFTKTITQIVDFAHTDIEDQVSAGGGSLTASWTAASGFWSAWAIAFKATGGAAAVTYPQIEHAHGRGGFRGIGLGSR